MGLIWKRTLTRTNYKHRCSDIHPSFKLANMATRECMRNKSWGPVDISQCVMDVGSPVVMILVVTLGTDNATLVHDKMSLIIAEVSISMSYYVCVIKMNKWFFNKIN